jgi:glycosyltransferase involved in cell wall biosynthesis
MPALRIELVVASLPAAGMEMVVAHLARGLLARGHDVGITCIEERGPLGEQLAREGIRVSVVPAPGLRTILFPNALADWFRELRPDVIHVHSGAWLKAARAARKAGVPHIVYTAHGLFETEQWHRPLLERWSARCTDAMVVVSEPLRTALSAVGVDPDRIIVLPNGMDTDQFRPGPASGRVRGRFGLAADTFVIGHVARFTPVKNHALLIDAFARVVKERPSAFLALIGDGPLRSAAEDRALMLGIADRIGFFGMASELPAIYRDFDLFVLSSLSEQTSISLLEAMATGIPVVATAVGGTPDLVGRGAAGRLVPSEDAGALANAIIALFDDKTARRTLADAGRRRVVEHYGMEAMLDGYEAVYRAASRRQLAVA